MSPLESHSQSQSHLASSPDSGRIRCVCEYDEDDGFTIQCEQCLVWQHAKCVGISKNSVPEQYFCEECNPGWHEDLHSLALKAINLDVTISNNPSNVNIIEDNNNNNTAANSSFSIPTRSFKRKIMMPPGVPALNEISENIISNEAQPIIDSFLKGLNVPRLKRQQNAQDPNLINFEFQSTVVLDSPEHLALLQKNLEVREIRTRGYQKKGSSTKYGLFATEPCDPGHFVCEFIGHVQVKSLLTVKGAREFPVPVTQSFVLYPFASIELAVDARKFGTGVRYARRSCRPNVQIKPIIVETLSNGDYYLSWGLFARNVIRANSEILLPLDYQCGNGLFRYECACNSPDFCLGPLDLSSGSGREAAALVNAAAVRPNSPKPNVADATELEALGIRRSSSAVLQDSQIPLTTATRPILDTRKLTREERKLQKYIEYFEKMDNADAAKKVTTSTSNSSIGSSSRRSGSVSGGSSPQPARISSPEKSGGLKKAWKNLFSSSGESDNVTGIINNSNSSESKDPATAATTTGKKRGRKPSVKSQSVEPLVDTSESVKEQETAKPEEKQVVSQKSPPKRKKASSSEVVAIVDEEVDVGSESASATVENKKAKVEKTKKTTISSTKSTKTNTSTNTKTIEMDLPIVHGNGNSQSSPLIDIERSSSVLNPVETTVITNAESVNPNNPVTSAATPETPSKKKLSLSDYLKKKKASPSGTNQLNFDEEEDGEIPAAPANEIDRFLSGAVVTLEEGEVGEYEERRDREPERRESERREYERRDHETRDHERREYEPRKLESSSSREFLRQSIGELTSSHDEFVSRSSSSSIVNGSRSDRESREKDRDYKEYRDREFKDYKDYKEQKEYKEYSLRDHSSYPSYPGYTGQSAHVSQSNYPVQSAYPAQSSYPNYPTHTSTHTSTHSSTHSNTHHSAYHRPARPPQMLSQPSAPISRYRDEREKEFDRLQREREFERREAEREKERRERAERVERVERTERVDRTDKSDRNDRIERVDRVVEQLPFPHDPRDPRNPRDPRDVHPGHYHHPSHSSNGRFYNHHGRGGYRPPFTHPHHNRNHPDDPQNSRPYRGGYKNHKHNGNGYNQYNNNNNNN